MLKSIQIGAVYAVSVGGSDSKAERAREGPLMELVDPGAGGVIASCEAGKKLCYNTAAVGQYHPVF